jgi:sugar-specific transcriptional regulator TrmB
LSLQEHGEKILHELGLTFSQAKLYIALVRFNGCATANELSVFSSIARQDVYRLLEELQRVGLVEKIVGNPATFRAIPVKETISILMERRVQRTSTLLRESAEFLAKFPEKNSAEKPQDNSQFVLIPKGEMIARTIEKTIKATSHEILVITPWREFVQWLFAMHELWRQAIERGVKMRWITESKPQTSDSGLETVYTILGHPDFRLRTIKEPPKEKLGIYDSREVFIAAVDKQNAAESPALWTNNPTMVYILQEYLEMKWKTATEYRI